MNVHVGSPEGRGINANLTQIQDLTSEALGLVVGPELLAIRLKNDLLARRSFCWVLIILAASFW
jgi:hypothetical protein